MDDYDLCDTIFSVGHNTAETHTVLWTRILDRLHGPDRPRLVVVDPRRTKVAAEADVHLPIRSGTNMALLNALQRELIVNGWIDGAFVRDHTVGFEKLEQTVMQYPAERAAETCGVPADDIRAAARIVGEAEALVSSCLQGVYQSNQATASACQVNNVNLLRGMVGKPGCTIFQMNGQPTAQNTRETGADGDLRRDAQLAEHSARRGAGADLERRADPDPVLGAAHARDADLPVRRGGLDPVPLGRRHQPGRLAAGAAPHTVDPRTGPPVRRGQRRVPQ
jgi:anaerobic selenocysteine-containing dehydrogenase